MTTTAHLPRSPPIAPRPRFVVIREKLEIRHSDPVHRKHCLHLHVRFEGPLETRAAHFMTIIDRYLPGLRVTDNEGRELTYLPFREVQSRLGRDPDAIISRKLGSFGGDEPALLYILLPKPLDVGEVLILRLTYEDPSPPLRRHGWRLIRCPPFGVIEAKSEESWTTFIEIYAPPGYEIDISDAAGLAREAPFQAHTSGYRDFKSFVQVRAIGGAPDVGLTYQVKPFPSERWLVRASYAIMIALPLIFFAASFLPSFGIPAGNGINIEYPPDVKYAQTVAAVGVPAIVAIIALAPSTGTNRLWYLLPLALYIVLLFWTGP